MTPQTFFNLGESRIKTPSFNFSLFKIFTKIIEQVSRVHLSKMMEAATDTASATRRCEIREQLVRQ
ncbi:hypothetical protein [Caballeronia sp. AZ7_KS35]|uniref:hypothetical protein n=1 Tax=Caballeronia sp. AZ7_KS35 TaxID=2921762 RepID=UPI0020283F70|nr:hypothetical protein [Caballeronia sp. AZ7_KS35]